MKHIKKQLDKIDRTLRVREVNGKEVIDSVPKKYDKNYFIEPLFESNQYTDEYKINKFDEVFNTKE